MLVYKAGRKSLSLYTERKGLYIFLTKYMVFFMAGNISMLTCIQVFLTCRIYHCCEWVLLILKNTCLMWLLKGFPLFIIFIIFQNYQISVQLLNVIFISERCQCCQAILIPIKYENDTWAKSEIPYKVKLISNVVVSPLVICDWTFLITTSMKIWKPIYMVKLINKVVVSPHIVWIEHFLTLVWKVEIIQCKIILM